MTAEDLGGIVSTLLAAGVALAAGFLIGFEREWTHTLEGKRHAFAGARTFALVGLTGALCGLVDESAILAAAGLIAVSALTIFAYARESKAEDGRGGTTEIALFVTFLLGVAAGRGELLLAAAGAVAVAGALSLKDEVRRLAHALGARELHATIRFLAIAVLILPVAPDRDFGPHGVLNPRDLWYMVVLISGLSFVGYWLVKTQGPARGVMAAGLVGGLASSTATTLSLARMTRAGTAAPRAAAAGVVVANVVMVARIAIVLAAAAPALLANLAAPLAAAAAAGGVVALALWRSSLRAASSPGAVAVGNPFELKPALLFAGLLAVVSLASAVAAGRLGETGLFAVAFASGLADVDAMTLSAARGAMSGAMAIGPAGYAVLIAVAANIIAKGAMALGVGGKDVGVPVIGAFGAMTLAGAGVLLV